LLQLVTKQLHYFYANQAKHIAKKIFFSTLFLS
jgi:hypothetical protein